MNINFLPSQYQWQIFAFVQGGQGHGVIEAVAGSGKTTTIVTATQLTNPTAKVAFVAFNKHIADTLGDRAPAHVHASTLHSLGFANIRRAWGNVQVDKDKLKHILANHKANGYDSSVLKLVSLCKAILREPAPMTLDYIADRWDIDVPEEERNSIYRLTSTVYRESLEQHQTIDYDDMIYFCASGMVGCQKFDILFGDEVQDWNRAQIEMALKSVKPNGRIIGVGDRNQSIYGFRAADVDAIPNLIKATDASTLPLSICYRCPSSHVALAQQLVPEIEAREDAPEGVIEDIEQWKLTERVRPGDLVICRCNAPLVRPAMRLISQGIKAVILGRDIGQGLMALLRKVQKQRNTFDLLSTLMALSQYVSAESAKMYASGKAMKAQSLQDRADTIEALAEGCQSFSDLEAKIAQVFSDDQQGITFSTVHRAKGTEADRVFILEPRLMPHPKASKPWEVQQERNIKYVALTRAKQELYLVNGSTPGQLASLPEGDAPQVPQAGAVVSSMPFLDNGRGDQRKNGGITDQDFRTDRTGQVSGTFYGLTPGNLGNLPAGDPPARYTNFEGVNHESATESAGNSPDVPFRNERDGDSRKAQSDRHESLSNTQTGWAANQEPERCLDECLPERTGNSVGNLDQLSIVARTNREKGREDTGQEPLELERRQGPERVQEDQKERGLCELRGNEPPSHSSLESRPLRQSGGESTGIVQELSCTSPCRDAKQSAQGGEANTEVKWPGRMDKVGDPQRRGDRNMTAEYGATEGQLGAMREGVAVQVQASVSSPPFEASVNTMSEKAVKRYDGWAKNPDGSNRVARSLIGNGYGQADGQLGTESGTTFWAASAEIMRQVYQVLAPGAVAVWVCKAFVRKGERVDFPGQWQALGESCGFETLEIIRAWLVEDNGAQHTLDGGLDIRQVQRKSFFRLLAEQKGSPKIDYEIVLIQRKVKE